MFFPEERQKALDQEEEGESSTSVQSSVPSQKENPAAPSFK